MMKVGTLVTALMVSLALTTPAYAYIDPGSGSIILQGVLAALAAIALTAKLWWHRLLVLLGLRKRTLPRPSPAAAQNVTRDEKSR